MGPSPGGGGDSAAAAAAAGDLGHAPVAALKAEHEVYVDAPVDFLEGPAFGETSEHLVGDGRGGDDASRRRAIAALRARIAQHDSAGVSELTRRWEDRSAMTLERFLRARDFDVDVAAALFLSHREWRERLGWRVGPHQLPNQLPGQTKVAFGTRLDSHGRPLMVVVVRNHDKHHRDLEELKLFMDKLTNAMGPGNQFHVLADLAGMTRRNDDLKALVAALDMLQARYVERCASIWFAEPPLIFWALWKIVSPFVAPTTRRKIAFLYGGAEVLGTMKAAGFEHGAVPVEYGGGGEMRWLTAAPAPWEAEGSPRLRLL